MAKVNNVLTAMDVKRRRRSGILSVKIVEGIRVRRVNPYVPSNPFVTLRLSHTDLQSASKTTVKHRASYPMWNEEFSLNVENIDVQSLLITVMSAQSVCLLHVFSKHSPLENSVFIRTFFFIAKICDCFRFDR